MKRLLFARIVGLVAGLLVLAAAPPARALLFTLSPRVGVGLTDNVYGVSNAQKVRTRDEFWGAGISSGLVLTLPRASHRLNYGFNMTRYFTYGGASSTSHNALWASTFRLSSHTTLGVGANAIVFQSSSVLAVDPMMPNAGMVLQTAAPAPILSASASQSLSYEPTGVDTYSQSLSVSMTRPLSDDSGVPRLVQVFASGRRAKIIGRDTYSLTVSLGDYFRLDAPNDPAISFGSGQVITGQVLAGWLRDISARTTFELQAGMLVMYGVGGPVAVGPAGVATLSYRSIPWFATLIASHQPSVNIFVGEAVIADSLTARLSLPLNQRETWFLTGFGTYTYARRVNADTHFVFASRVFDLVALGSSLLYRFERLPIGIALDYSLSSQRGSRGAYQSTARQTLGLSIGGSLAWGEGNTGLMRSR